jgi:hypothetical protein
MISVRRHSEGLLERPAEMVRAQSRQFGEGRERDVVGDVLLDKGGHPLLLPARKTATAGTPAECSVTIDANEFMRQRDAKHFAVLPGIEPEFSISDFSLRAVCQRSLSKKQSRLEFDLLEPQRRIGERPARIDVEIGDTRQCARFLPSAEVMLGRNKSELVPEIAKRRPGQPFNKGLAVVALGNFSGDEQMPWSTESIFKRRVPHDLDRLRV